MNSRKATRTGRLEDDPLLRGLGRYTADVAEGALVARFARANVAHARIRSLGLEEARGMFGVEAVFAMADLAALLPKEPGPIDAVKNRDGSMSPVPSRPCLAHDRIRFV